MYSKPVNKTFKWFDMRCNKSFDTEVELKEHLKTHNRSEETIEPLIESINAKNFITSVESLVGQSIETNYSQKYELISQKTIEKPKQLIKVHKCPDISCNKLFISEEYLRNHMKSVHKNHTIIERVVDFDNQKQTIVESNEGMSDSSDEPIDEEMNGLTDYKTYSDIECNDVFETQEVLNQQMNTCVKSTETIKTLIGNQISIKTNESIEGLNGNKSQNEKNLLTEEVMEIEVNSSSGGEKCNFIGCDYRFGTKDQYFRHLADCHKYRYDLCEYKCSRELCPKRFQTLQSLKQHQRLIHPIEQEFKCDFSDCHKVFKSFNTLQQHMISHSNEYPFRCDAKDCQFSTKLKGSLKRHKMIHQMNEKNTIAEELNELKCVFNDCIDGFETKEQYFRHLAEYHRNYKLPKACPMSVSQRIEFLDKHMDSRHKRSGRSSGQELNCQFVGCVRRFTTKGQYYKHLADCHKDFRPFKCSHEPKPCDMSFNTPYKVVQHIREFHMSDEQEFDCDFKDCNKVFKTKKYLIQHRKSHIRRLIEKSKDRIYKCLQTECFEAFETQKGLNQHMKSRHKTSDEQSIELTIGTKTHESIEELNIRLMKINSLTEVFETDINSMTDRQQNVCQMSGNAFKCPNTECKELLFANEESLKSHQKTVHWIQLLNAISLLNEDKP